MKRNPYQEITDGILASLKQGVKPWHKPWTNSKRGAPVHIPQNALTGNRYNGCNVFLLWHAGCAFGWDDMRFATYKQAQELGGHVRKGERGSKIIAFRVVEKKTDTPKNEGEKDCYAMVRAYSVFNVAQCDGLPEHAGGDDRVTEMSDDEFGAFIYHTGADIRHGGNRAYHCYGGSVGENYIQMPHRADFESDHAYRSTLLHELTHWTGTPHRLDRTKGRFGDRKYAFEELIAELGAALLCAEFGFNPLDRVQSHSDYIGDWIDLLNDHDRAFQSAASQAQKAVDYLREMALRETELAA